MKKIWTSLLLCNLSIITFCQYSWTKFGTSPVLERDTVFASLSNDFYAISDNFVLREGDLYKMWYTCGGFNYPTDEFNLRARICYCESSDGINWEKSDANPVMDVSYDGWDSLGVETVSVLIDPLADPSQRYKMWYAGLTDETGTYHIGYAYSSDGLNWSKAPEPVLLVGSDTQWDNGFLEGPSVILEDGTYHMWYAAFDGVFDGQETDGYVSIGYAYSSDGINWEKYENNPVLEVSPFGWDSIYVQDPHVLKIEGIYYMWYGGANQYDLFGQQVGIATSLDGINWNKSIENPVLVRGESGTWDENTASFPSVLWDEDGSLKMWYTGKDVEPLPEGSTDYFWEIGYAVGTTVFSSIDFEVKDTILVAPNPFKDYILININGDFVYQMYTAVGDLILEGNGSNKAILETNNLSNGSYVLTLISNNQHLTYKLIK